MISDIKCTLLYEDCCYRTASLIKLCLDDNSTGITLRICLQFKYISSKYDHLEKILDTLTGVSGYRTEYRLTAPLLGNKFIL